MKSNDDEDSLQIDVKITGKYEVDDKDGDEIVLKFDDMKVSGKMGGVELTDEQKDLVLGEIDEKMKIKIKSSDEIEIGDMKFKKK